MKRGRYIYSLGQSLWKKKYFVSLYLFYGRAIFYGKGKVKARKYIWIDLGWCELWLRYLPTLLMQLQPIPSLPMGSLHKPPHTSCLSQGPNRTVSGAPGEYKIYWDFLRQLTQTNKTNIVLIFQSTSLNLYFRMPLKNLSLSRNSLKQLESHERHHITRVPVCAACYYRHSEQRQGLNF